MTKVLVVGERFNMPERPDWTRRADEDPEWWLRMGLRLGAFHDVASRTKLDAIGVTEDRWAGGLNLTPPGPQLMAWQRSLARRVASALDDSDFDAVALCGRRVAQAFGLGHLPFLEADGKRLVLPHPSGLCRLWNDTGFVREARDFIEGRLLCRTSE